VPTQPTFDDLINAMVSTESSGQANARGKAGEVGLLQIKPSTARDYGVKDPRALLDPTTNKAVGSRILSDLLKRYRGDVTKALEAYNSGRKHVDSGRIPASALTYADKVLGRMGTGDSPSRLASSPQGPAFSPNMMLAVPPSSGGSATSGESLRDRFMRIFSPASASAAETLEIPRVGPPATRGVPIPPGAKIGGASARRGTVPIPPGASIGARIDAKFADRKGADIDARIEAKLKGGASSAVAPAKADAAKPLPALVRAADWAPMAGQIGGEVIGGGLSAETGPGAIIGAGVGGGLGEGTGELADVVVRKAYGLPRPSGAQFAKDAGISGAISAAGVPAGKVLSKVGEVIAPSTLKAAIAARRGYDASREAFDATMKKISDALGLDAKAAAVASASPLERRQVRAAFLGARQAGFDQAGQVYQDIAKSYVGRMTPNASAVSYSNFSNKYGARSLSLLDNGIDFTRPSWRMIQQFRSNVRKMMRHLPPDSGNMASDLRRLERTATQRPESDHDARRFAATRPHRPVECRHSLQPSGFVGARSGDGAQRSESDGSDNQK
jgi:Transglycosylase SLT domain